MQVATRRRNAIQLAGHALWGSAAVLVASYLGVQSYTYEGVNRLATFTEAGTVLQGYTYDSTGIGYGNRWISSGTFIPYSTQTPQSNNFTNNQWSPGTNGYDTAGNQTSVFLGSGGTRSFTYDAENRQIDASIPGMSAISYVYDGEGRRVQKTVGTTVTIFVYDAAGNLTAEYGPPSSVAGTTYLTADHLGSTRLVTNASGAAVARYDYAPFGEELTAGIDGRTTAQGFSTNQYPTVTPDGTDQKFTGKERDAETGLDYFGARYNSSAEGRFTSPDPYEIVVQKNKGKTQQEQQTLLNSFISNPQALNKYAYGLNNPLKNIDVGGHCSAPAGLKGGQTGICVEAFIAAKTINGIGRGDGRTFSPTDGTYRFRVDVRVDPGANGNISINTDTGRSGVIVKGLGFKGEGTATVSGSATDDSGNRTFTVSGTAVNGEQFINQYVPFFNPAPQGDISFDLKFTVTPGGEVTLDKAESRTFPSLEIYNYDSSGAVTQKVLTFPEQNSNDLTKPKQCIGGPECRQ
jgi:RHS repeat-associated protein